MSHLRENGPEENNLGFKWGIEKGPGAKNRDTMFYESFFHKGEEYFVYDCVYFYLGQPEASIGKLVKLFESPNHVKKVKVVWFMRPSEIRNHLRDYEPRWNEIFLATGQGRGVSNINLAELIGGKCNVVCTSNDQRNPQASHEDLRCADYVFCRHFDVGELAILDNFPDMVDGVKVEHFFNKKKGQKQLDTTNLKSNVEGQTQRPNLSFKFKVAKENDSKVAPVSTSKQLHLPSKNTSLRPKTSISNSGTQHSGSLQSQAQDEIDKAEVKYPRDSPTSAAEETPCKKRKLFCRGKDKHLGSKDLRELKKQDLVWHALKEKVEAKMIGRTAFSCPCYGKALLIFKSKEAANSAINQLMERCLMLADGRPLIARREPIRTPAKVAAFVGHLTIDKVLQKQTEEVKKAKSTSHASQPNNIEFDMGMKWRILQMKSDMSWKALHERQAKEIQALRNQLKMKWLSWRCANSGGVNINTGSKDSPVQ
ncbi:Bromo-adjacent domain-containing protein, putative isoform 3 [Hibiscus syriacus]|uniref:Bromo-adjacent domain-containing protein, putative isoform 3 n=1 Tax=Hibiscus syriacus TaxID=106335 RepID=A0A6A3B2S6_HIBSY|nr:Bromo-adjacent domain-containing protein, putative isoform 3 [Hibiscus syriacus]